MRAIFGIPALCLVLGAPAGATDIFVGTGETAMDFDRSAWEAAVEGTITDEPFDMEIPQADVLVFDSGIESAAAGANEMTEHLVMEGEFFGTLRTSGSTAPGYLTFTWEFPEPVTAFGANFFSIGGSREVSVEGTFDAGAESFVLRTLFMDDGGVDRGFFGLTSAVPFESITLIANGSIDSNDAFTVDDVAFAVPEPGRREATAVALALLGGLGRAHRRRDGR